MLRIAAPIVGIIALLGAAALFVDRADPQFHLISDTAYRAVYLVPDPDAAEATVHLIIQAGELDNDGPEGLAHYVEHLAWLDVFQSSGVRADRHANAWTNGNSTVYWESFRPTELAKAVGRMSKVLTRPTLDTSFSLQERDIVQREYDLRVIGDPYDDVSREMQQLIFADTPYARSVIGTPESIAAMTVEGAMALYDRTHRAENAVVVVYGDFSVAQVERAFGGGHLDRAPTLPTAFPSLPEGIFDDEQTVTAPIATPLLIYQKLIKRPDCNAKDDCDAAINMLDDMLDSALPGGLAGPLRFDNFLARSFDMGLYQVGEDGILFYFAAETDEGVKPVELHAALVDALNSVAQSGMSQETFSKVKDRGLADFDADNDKQRTMRDVLIASASIREEPQDLAFGRAAWDDVTPEMTLSPVAKTTAATAR